MTNLLPCPFCGSKEIEFNKCTLRIKCKKCFAQSGTVTRFIKQGMGEQEAAMAAWNERVRNETHD